MLSNARNLVDSFGPSVKGQVVEGVVDCFSLSCTSDDVKSGQGKFDVPDILMKLYGEVFFVGGELLRQSVRIIPLSGLYSMV